MHGDTESNRDGTQLSIDGIRSAAAAIAPHLPVTPAWSYPLLDQRIGASVVVKHENVQPIGAFKVRGGVNLLATLTPEQRRVGLVTASTGNHGQSIAYAARRFGVPVTIVAPLGSPPRKLAAIRGLGAGVVLHGEDMGAAGAHARALADTDGLHYVDPGDTPAIVHGHGTVYLELLQQYPDLDTIYVPVGSGTGAAGACLVRDALAPACRVVGVQSEAAPAAYRSWRSGQIERADCDTVVSGLATSTGYALPQSVLAAGLADFLLVSDAAIASAAAILATDAHTLAEGAGAAALAGLLADPNRGARVAIVVTGGNASDDEIAALVR